MQIPKIFIVITVLATSFPASHGIPCDTDSCNHEALGAFIMTRKRPLELQEVVVDHVRAEPTKDPCVAGQEEKKGKCINCSPGSFSTDPDVGCKLCLKNSYQDKYAQTTCIPCPGTKITTGPGAKSVSSCFEKTTNCPAGSVPSFGGNCRECLPGTFAQSGDVECTICPAGTFSGFGLNTCIKCDAGTFSRPGSRRCSKCPRRSVSMAGAGTCQRCPRRTKANRERTTCLGRGPPRPPPRPPVCNPGKETISCVFLKPIWRGRCKIVVKVTKCRRGVPKTRIITSRKRGRKCAKACS